MLNHPLTENGVDLMARQPVIEDHKPEDELQGHRKVERSVPKR